MPNANLIAQLKGIVGRRHVLTDPRATQRFRKGFRSGSGDALAVVIPGTLIEFWNVLRAAVAADVILIMQAANTGLTEGSTPKGRYDRDVLIVSTLRMKKIHLLQEGRQVVSLPGGTLYDLESLLEPLGREPHSVIGSSCIGASVVGGVCNNSGGSLVQRGPAYTEQAMYAEVTAEGELRLVNNLGLDLGNSPEAMLAALEAGHALDAAIVDDERCASDNSYTERVRAIDADTPARFNADPRGLFEASGSAGKIAVFAVRLDTFPKETATRVYYVGTNDPANLTDLRRRMLDDLPELPISGEYLHRECFDIARTYGKDTLLMIHWLGTKRLPGFFALKGRIDGWTNALTFLPKNLSDRVMQGLSRLLPEALPRRMLDYRNAYEHHLILKVSVAIADQTEAILETTVGEGWFRCDPVEEKKAMLHRFAAAGAAVRYGAVHNRDDGDILALDIALRRNDRDWVETLPPTLSDKIDVKLYYGHFFCHVFHQDYVLKQGEDAGAVKKQMLELLDTRGAEYPAEHNVGHLYTAKPALAEHYRALDPCNHFNPGIGKTSRDRNYGVGQEGANPD